MSKPLNSYRAKGLQLADWGEGKYSIEKSFKRKTDTEWTRYRLSLFKNELIELQSLIEQALAAPEVEGQRQQVQEPEVLPASKGDAFDDDSIPF